MMVHPDASEGVRPEEREPRGSEILEVEEASGVVGDSEVGKARDAGPKATGILGTLQVSNNWELCSRK